MLPCGDPLAEDLWMETASTQTWAAQSVATHQGWQQTRSVKLSGVKKWSVIEETQQGPNIVTSIPQIHNSILALIQNYMIIR